MNTNDTIDELLGQHDEQHIFKLVLERKRKLNHAKAKEAQPTTAIQIDADSWDKIRTFATRTIEDTEAGQAGLDHLTMSVADCLSAGDADDLLFALLRVWRKTFHMQTHLGAIEALLPTRSEPKP